jgi:hypothetical protein
VQAYLNRERAMAPKRRFYFRLRLEVGMRPVVAEPGPEQRDPLEKAYRQQQAEQQVDAERDATFRRLRLG